MNNKTDHIEATSEELRLNGFDVEVFEKIITYDAIFGTMTYKPVHKYHMDEYYRFIMIYGMKLQKWALKQRNEQQNKRNLTQI